MNLRMVFPYNALGWGAGGKPLSNGGPPEARLGFQWAPSITMGCGACWDETCREKGDVVRGGWADVARRLPRELFGLGRVFRFVCERLL